MNTRCMGLVLGLLVTALPARARAQESSSTSPYAAAGLSAGLTLGGLGIAVVVARENQIGAGILMGGFTLLVAPSAGRMLLGGHAGPWIGSRLLIGAVGAGLTALA